MKKLGNIKPQALSSIRKAVERWPIMPSLGYIEGESLQGDESFLSGVRALLAERGYRPRGSSLYNEYQLMVVRGSIGPHVDHDFGLSAFWLIGLQPIRFNTLKHNISPGQTIGGLPYLITRREDRSLKVGDVVVFDSDRTHSWICNQTAYAVTITVSPVRKEKR